MLVGTQSLQTLQTATMAQTVLLLLLLLLRPPPAAAANDGAPAAAAAAAAANNVDNQGGEVGQQGPQDGLDAAAAAANHNNGPADNSNGVDGNEAEAEEAPPAPPAQVTVACPQTASLLMLATRPFANRNAHCYSTAFRARAHIVFLVGERLWQQRHHPHLDAQSHQSTAASGAVASPSTLLPFLPRELWEYILLFVARKDWSGREGGSGGPGGGAASSLLALPSAPSPPSPTPALLALDEYLLQQQQ